VADSVGLAGIWGRPFIDLEPVLDLSMLSQIHEEICLGLAQVPVSYTGGSHRTMRIMPECREDEAFVDYGEVLAKMSEAERETFVSLGDPALQDEQPGVHQFGEEREHCLSRRQMLFLKYRYGVYFPWKVYYEMIPNKYWDEKSRAAGKRFTREARTFFPKTVEFVKSLPFTEIGRCNIMGLEANDHGTVHRDGDPATKPDVDHFISICPNRDKSLFLWDDAARRQIPIESRAYWFNDSDYHGVDRAPFFRYSIRVDGRFEPEFLAALRTQQKLSRGAA
jgi:hypothetical protein